MQPRAPDWAELARELDHLLTLPPLERARHLESIAANDAALGARLSHLMAQREAASREGFLQGVAETAWIAPALAAGMSLGAWTLDQPLGEGGMGSVWRAHRSDGRFEGEAAVKVLKNGVFDAVSRERFRREGAILARLKHAGIAQLYDAGITDAGLSYLVLELVRGESIDGWCDARRWKLRARIELFLQVLDAVAAAHAQLVVHRDLKPSNILVDDQGRVRLLDFGIARLLPGSKDAQTALTREGAFALTPRYAAPEQATQEGALTTATDVYALGVVLHELLTGVHPSGLSGATPMAYLQAAGQGAAQRASAWALQPVAGAETPEARALARASSPIPLARQLRGDLDNILARALKPLAAERYPTVTALAEDLRRHLRHEPVSAQRDALGYRAAKFVRRHRGGVAAATLVSLALLAGAAGTAWQAKQAERERDHALQLARRNAALVEFFESMLTQAAQDRQAITVPELVRRSQAIASAGNGDAETDAAVLMMLSNITVSMDDAAASHKLLADADARLRTGVGAADPTLRAMLGCSQGFVASLQGRLDEAQALFARALPLAAADPATHAECLLRRAYVAQNHNNAQGALADAEQALALLRASGTASPLAQAGALGNVAYGHHLSGHTAQADAAFAQTIAQFRALGRGDTPVVVTFLNNWGIASFAAGDIPRARASYDEALAIAARLAPNAPPPFYLLRNRAVAELDLAQHASALADFRRVQADALAGGNPMNAAFAGVGIALALLESGERDAALQAVAEARRGFGATLPPDSMPAIAIQQFQAREALRAGRLAEARDRYGQVIAFFDARGMQVAPVVAALRNRADAQLRSGAPDAAAADLARALALAQRLQGDKPYSSHVGRTLAALQRLQLARGQGDEARRTAAAAAEHLARALGADHPDTRQALAAAAPP